MAAKLSGCSTTAKRINVLVQRGLLSSQETSGWMIPTRGLTHLNPLEGKVVIFASFYERGLGLPAHSFLRGILHFYQLENHHLNPTGVLHIAAFTTLCEACLGIEPNVSLWKHFFDVRPVMKSDGRLSGCTGIQIWNKKGQEYVPASLADSNRGWHSEWFYVDNVNGSLPKFTGALTFQLNEWCRGNNVDEWKHWVTPGLEAIRGLREAGVTLAELIFIFTTRRIQPLKARMHPMFKYIGSKDPTRETAEFLALDDAKRRTRALLNRGSTSA